MRNVIVIFKKELKSYFASPIAYLLLAIFARSRKRRRFGRS